MDSAVKYEHWHGKYLNEDEIVEDMVNKISIDGIGLQRWTDPRSWRMPITNDGRFDAEAPDHAGCLMFAGMQVRNYYGLWHPECPYTKPLNGEYQMMHGIITDPRHPDNFSGRIITRVRVILEASHNPN